MDCGPHGSCISGMCQCEEGWTGAECEQRDCHPRCIDHGICREGKCDCHQGWTGEHCTIGEQLSHTHTHTCALHLHTHVKWLQTREHSHMDRLRMSSSILFESVIGRTEVIMCHSRGLNQSLRLDCTVKASSF